MPARRRWIAAGACAFAVLASTVAGCGSTAATPSSNTLINADKGIDTSVLRTSKFRFKPYNSPEELAAADFIKVTATGTVEGFKEGRTFHSEPGNTPYYRVYMVVKVDRPYKGAQRREYLGDNRLYVDLDRGPINAKDGVTPLHSLDDFSNGIPAGTKVALFLHNAPKISDQISDIQRGLPAGVEPLSPHPQGMIFASPEKGIQGKQLIGGLTGYSDMPKPWQDIHSMEELAQRMAKVS
ncbi:hypothetical protein ACLQ2R_31005 [Streptosporangium sp. DT93]|uniref:hypothetical protein n=1 Tax=Streptosporangium sp. DT93 TaxID=3393428 RepID=UPI003CEF1B64